MAVSATNSGEDDLREVLAALTGDNFGTPSGWPRPTSNGLPIPWTTPCVGDRVIWSGVIEQRVTACRERWLCQVCGMALEETAWAVIEYGNLIVGGAALHKRCLTVAQSKCPRLAHNSADYSEIEISRSQLGPARDGDPSRVTP